MATYSRLTILLTWLACIALMLATPAAAADASSCPSQVDDVLASQAYSDCRAVIPGNVAWVFSSNNADAIHKSSACSEVLNSLHAISFDVCVVSIVSTTSSTIPATRVTIHRQELSQIASTAQTTRRLRERVTRLLPEGGATGMNYNYLYIGLGVAAAVLVLCCVLSRCGMLCCCIPIPLCC